MNVKMVYHTPELHKLVEAVARVCYQSYGKLSPTSHEMIKGIMNKGHLSIASVGNMVFEMDLSGQGVDMGYIVHLLDSLCTFKQINNFVRWTTPARTGSEVDKIIISMNMLTLLDIIDNIKEFTDSGSDLLFAMLDEVDKVPYLKWFYAPTTVVPPSDSPYIGDPALGHPVILSQDYTALKALGLTDYELDIHSTITVDYMTDRASGLQSWRHGDMTGGCELSQRYCDRSTAVVREMVGVDEYPTALQEYADKEGISIEEAREHYDAVITTLRREYHNAVGLYSDLNDTLKELGVSAKRAKEIARSVLPNAMSTRIIQCRPLRQWKHFINLRDTLHAQQEIREDTQALKKALDAAGVLYG